MIAEYNVNLENKTKSELILFIKELHDMLKEKDEQIAKYEKIYKEYDCYRWVKELEKKDKQLDLMAKEIEERDIEFNQYCNFKIVCDRNCKVCIKQYFEKLAKEKGE